MLDAIRKSQKQKYPDVASRIKAYQLNSELLEKVAFNVQTLEIMLSEDERAAR